MDSVLIKLTEIRGSLAEARGTSNHGSGSKPSLSPPQNFPTMSAKEAPTLALLSRAHSPTSVARIYAEKIQHRPLLLKPSEPTTTNPSARQQRHLKRVHKLEQRKRKLKPRPLTAKAKRASHIYTIPKSGQKYEVFEGLHQMWEAYIREVLFDNPDGWASGPITGAGAAPKLVSADYHGAELEVVRSRCVSRVGVKGIVIKETKFTFELITKNNTVKSIPKEGTVFQFILSPSPATKPGIEKTQEGAETKDSVGGGQDAMGDTDMNIPKVEEAIKPLVFEIYGAQFQTRASDRAIKKTKPHYFPLL